MCRNESEVLESLFVFESFLEVKIAMDNFIAHDGQSLETHLSGVGNLSRSFAAKINLGSQGQLIGLLHDFGKYSKEFQDYLKSALGKINPDEDDYVDAAGLKGKIDHSTAGAQYIWNAFGNQGSAQSMVG